MEFRHYNPSESKDIAAMFEAVFRDSEGDTEGKLIGNLADELLKTTNEEELICVVAIEDRMIIGSIFLSRLSSDQNHVAFILAPVAVKTSHQGKGIGQKLIRYGIDELKDRGIKIVITYGDPDFYSRVGFRSISSDSIRPPYRLSQPDGWLGLSLSEDPIEDVSGDFTCVEALNKPAYW